MTRATKTTVNRLQRTYWNSTARQTLADILIERIEISENIQSCIDDGFTLTPDDYYKGCYTEAGLYIKAQEWEKRYFSGIQTRYPKLIETTYSDIIYY